jgi:hypothetical protein
MYLRSLVSQYSIIQNNERKCTCDTKKFGPLVKKAAEKYDIDKVHADKAYDNRKNFNILY